MQRRKEGESWLIATNTILSLLSIFLLMLSSDAFSFFFQHGNERSNRIDANQKHLHVVFFYKQENNILTFIETKIIIYLHIFTKK